MAGVDAGRFRATALAAKASPVMRYGSAAYWKARYAADGGMEAFEWYLRWEQLRETLMPFLTHEDDPDSKATEILLLGCGTSALGEQIYAEGFVNITNVDRCEEVVAAVQERHKAQLDGTAAAAAGAKGKKPDKKATPEPVEAKQPMTFVTADAASLPQDWAGRFDVVIDKAMLDAVACGADRWQTVEAVMQSTSRVLKPGSGVYVSISHAGPEVRKKMLIGPHQDDESDFSAEYRWDFGHSTLPRPLSNPNADPKAKDKVELAPSALYNAESDVYHIYTCRRRAQ